MRARQIEQKKTRGSNASRVAELRPIGVIRSNLKERSKAPKQGSEGAPDAWLEVRAFAVQGLDGLAAGDEIIVLTWLHKAHREVLKVHPRSDPSRRLTGVICDPFSRSAQSDRPPSSHGTQARQEPSADRPNRSDRRHPSNRYQAGALRNPKALIDRQDSYATSLVSAPNR